jgi:hypothetical protein
MATKQVELAQYSGSDIFAKFPQVSMNDHITAIFGASAGAEVLGRCTPVGFNKTTGFYGKWMAPAPASIVIDTDDADGGVFVITVDGVSSGNIAWNATAESIRTTLLGMGYVATVTKVNEIYTITFDAETQVVKVPVLTGTVTGLTKAGGAVTAEAATVTAGTSSYGLHTVVGFVWPDEITLDATLQVQGEVMVSGRISYTYIVVNVASGDVDALKAELKNNALARDIVVEDLANIH